MFLSYLWRAENIAPSAARQVFASALEHQCSLYSKAWGFPARLNIHQQRNILIGHISIDTGVVGWRSWLETDDCGLVWNGICERFLGSDFGDQQVRAVSEKLSRSPETVCDWDGKFYVITWSRTQDSVTLTTGATDCPTLWYTDGPRGWAAGSRAAPILDLVGHQKQISTAACNIFLAYGYNYTDESLLEHACRVPQRTQLTLRPASKPKWVKYATLAQLVQPPERRPARNEILESCAGRLVERVRLQLKYSNNPEILVTGGRDSRCVAAAARWAGYNGVVSTGGAADSDDVVIGRKVAQCLGLTHHLTADRVPMPLFRKAVGRLKLWSSMSEGAEVIRHARACNDFVEARPPPGKRQQLFHGLGGEISRGYYYHNVEDPASLNTRDYSVGRQILLDAADPRVPLTGEARDRLEARWEAFSQDLGTDRVTVAQWLDLFFWQNSCLRWGADMLSVKNPMYWIWTPFLDRQLITGFLQVEPGDKRSDRFVEDLALQLAGELKGLEYDVPSHQRSTESWFISRFKRALGRGRAGRDSNRETVRFWEDILLKVQNPVWMCCLDEKLVNGIIHSQPGAEFLWNAATIQLLFESFRSLGDQ